MPIVGFVINSLSAGKKGRIKDKLNVNSVPKITSITSASSDIFKGKKALKINFDFLINYDPKIAEIKMSGTLMYVGSDIKSIQTKWKKNKTLPKNPDMEIKNFLFRKCLTLGLNLSESLQLPPPLFFPRIVPKAKKK